MSIASSALAPIFPLSPIYPFSCRPKIGETVRLSIQDPSQFSLPLADTKYISFIIGILSNMIAIIMAIYTMIGIVIVATIFREQEDLQ